MNSKIVYGLSLFSFTSLMAYSGYTVRTAKTTPLVKELAAVLEVSGHFISYCFYADAYKDSLVHMTHGELITGQNNVVSINDEGTEYFYIPMNGKFVDVNPGLMIDYLAKKVKEYTGISYNDALSYMPYIVWPIVESSKLVLPNIAYNSWISAATAPDKLPAAKTVGLIGMMIYCLDKMPYYETLIPQYIKDQHQYLQDWGKYPAKDTLIGKLYRDYVLQAWEIIHEPHHFYEEAEASYKYYVNGDMSPLTKEVIGLMGEHV